MATRRRRRGSGLFLIRAAKTGIYQIRGTVFGQTIRESTRTTSLEIAEAMRVQAEQILQRRKLHGPQAVATFGEAVVDYLDANPQLDLQDRKFVGALNDHFGDTLLSEIDQLTTQKFASLRYPGNGPSSVGRQVYTPLIAILRYAAKNKKCAMPMLERPRGKKKVVEHAPDEWVNAFLVGCQNKQLRGIVWLMTTTGCRVSEACRIRWDNVSFDLATALVERTKNGKPRSLPIETDLLMLLRELHADCSGRGLVFGYTTRSGVNMALQRESERLGLKHYSSHKLGRHAIATRMLNAGYTCKEVADAVGWTGASGIALVAGTYGHLEQSKVKKAMLDVSKGLGSPRGRTKVA